MGSVLEGKLVKRVCALSAEPTAWTFQIVDINAEQPLLLVPGFFDFVLYPLAFCGAFADKNDDTRPVSHVVINPLLDATTFSLKLFPFIWRHRLIAIHDAHISYLLDPHYIVIETETIKDLALGWGHFHASLLTGLDRPR